MTEPMRLIIDTDAGVDDAQAIMMALAHPGVTIEAITTLSGNRIKNGLDVCFCPTRA